MRLKSTQSLVLYLTRPITQWKRFASFCLRTDPFAVIKWHLNSRRNNILSLIIYYEIQALIFTRLGSCQLKNLLNFHNHVNNYNTNKISINLSTVAEFLTLQIIGKKVQCMKCLERICSTRQEFLIQIHLSESGTEKFSRLDILPPFHSSFLLLGAS